VTFPPGRARLATKPVATGSMDAPAITIGMVRVAFMAAVAPTSVDVTMTSTPSATRSAARAANRLGPPPRAVRNSIAKFWPATRARSVGSV
jgi:hypothetical protein